MIINCKINVSKITKDRLFKGKSGVYLDCTLIPSTNDKFGNDYMIVEAVTKTEREAGVRGAIIGNAKNYSAGATRKQPEDQTPAEGGGDDLPF